MSSSFTARVEQTEHGLIKTRKLTWMSSFLVTMQGTAQALLR